MKKQILTLSFLITTVNLLSAKEGMWIPSLIKMLNEADMQANGLKLSAEDLYSINQSSIKDAIVLFGGGCTGEIISNQGLLLTNHHCGYSSIQTHSSVENDYLTHGFWAKTKKDELHTPDLTASFIVRIKDVTAEVLNGTIDTALVKTDEEINEQSMDTMDTTSIVYMSVGMVDTASVKTRAEIIKQNIDEITASFSDSTNLDAIIKPYSYGNKYYMFVTKTYKDVRLVGAPPSSIGKFGGDTDNWIWPRHTGDFSLFRIYADSANQPAEYSENNVPYQPAHHLPISLKDLQEGDFTMVYGFPGSTQQYLTSDAVDYIINKGRPAQINMRDSSLSIIRKFMKEDDETRIKYASKHARISNYHKKWQGEIGGLKRVDALGQKRNLEEKFQEKAVNSPNYGNVLMELKRLYGEREKLSLLRDYFVELYYYGPEIIRFASSFKEDIAYFQNDTLAAEQIETRLEGKRKYVKKFFKNYREDTDRELFISLVRMYRNRLTEAVGKENLHYLFDDIFVKHGGIKSYTDQIYNQSALVNENRVLDSLVTKDRVNLEWLNSDWIYQFYMVTKNHYFDEVKPKYDSLSNLIDAQNKLYVKGLMELLPNERKYYPDANRTLRITYGKIEGYESGDGNVYTPFTTHETLLAKIDQDDDEFKVDPKMLTLLQNKDFGRYGKDGGLKVCFLASNHTTGGNSGSPVIDGEGNLIGLNFDRHWESTMSDILFDPEKCRNISVDINYVLWVIDKYAGAGHLVEEMTIIE